MFEKENLCERAKKNKRDIFFSCETCTKIIVIDLIIVKLFEVCPVVFPFKRNGFPRKFCVLVCDYYFGLIIFFFFIILFGAQQLGGTTK